MDDQLDNDLKNRIKEVFENYEDTAADEGWLLLREKFPEQKKRRAIGWYWWGAAAILLLFLGAGILFNSKNSVKPQIAYHPKNGVKPSDVKTDSDSSVTTIKPDPFMANTDQRIFRKKDHKIHTRNNDTDSRQQFQGSHIQQTVNGNNLLIATDQKKQQNLTVDSAYKLNNTELVTDKVVALNKTNSITQQAITAENVADSVAKHVRALATINAKPQPEEKKTIYDLFKNDSQKPIIKESNKEDKKVRFSVYATTYFNYAKGSDNQFNGGAGITSDISLSKNFKLSTGLAIGQNTLNYNSSLPEVAGKTFGVAAAAFTVNANTNNFNVAIPTLKNYSANLVALDVPVNLKFMVNPDRSDAFISAGLSSGTFANETYVLRYNNPSFFNASVVQTQDETTHRSFSNFYFANTLNFSFGIGYPISKVNRLTIEPFFKYPLQGLGDQQIRFGSGGLNLKFNFQPQKK